METLILASTSAYRRELLSRLKVPFDVKAPRVDEAELPGEEPHVLAARLARQKALAVAAESFTVIGADQVASKDGHILRKPGTPEKAVVQLLACQGAMVDFHTAVTVVQTSTGRERATIDHTKVWFRRLPEAALRRYVELDQSWDCAGGFKAESLGCSLFERIENDDPTALIGLPMIWLAGCLMDWGFSALTA
jgi:septum formation protein